MLLDITEDIDFAFLGRRLIFVKLGNEVERELSLIGKGDSTPIPISLAHLQLILPERRILFQK